MPKVPSGYIHMLAGLYDGQVARVRTDCLSKEFDSKRGTKQGDPLSSLLFYAVLQDITNDVKDLWNKHSYGAQLGWSEHTILQSLRFADDTLLFASSATKLERMLDRLAQAARERGLEIHPDKTKALHNTKKEGGRGCGSHLRLLDMELAMLLIYGEEFVKYLGCRLTCVDPKKAEIEIRISMAWKNV